MTWRTVVVRNRCKLSYKDDYLTVFGEKEAVIHLSEINTLLVENTAVNLTAYLLCELNKRKIKVIFCDHNRNPYGEIVPYHGAHNASKKLRLQSSWRPDVKAEIWQKIIHQKITNQANLLEKLNAEKETVDLINGYLSEIQPGDVTNREAHAAKVYFRALFGEKFSRDSDSDINAALNYGYSILLSAFNREISASGYNTAIGVNHTNEFNPFNLTSDLMEPFRPFVDELVYKHRVFAFDDFFKERLVNILNHKVEIEEKKQFLTNAVSIYVNSFFRCMESGDLSNFSIVNFYED